MSWYDLTFIVVRMTSVPVPAWSYTLCVHCLSCLLYHRQCFLRPVLAVARILPWCSRSCSFSEWVLWQAVNEDRLQQGLYRPGKMKTVRTTFSDSSDIKRHPRPGVPEVTYIAFCRVIFESTVHENWKHVVFWIQLKSLVGDGRCFDLHVDSFSDSNDCSFLKSKHGMRCTLHCTCNNKRH